MPIWIINLIKKAFPFRFIIAQLTRIPFIRTILDNWLFKGDDIVYLAKDISLKKQIPVKNYENIILPSHIVDYFIEKAGFLWVMNSCICRSSNKCR